jgi:hypothetical protein
LRSQREGDTLIALVFGSFVTATHPFRLSFNVSPLVRQRALTF